MSVDILGQLVLRGGNLILGIAVTILLVRALGTGGFGQWSTVMAVVTIVLYLGDLGLEQVAVKHAAADPAHEREWVASLVTLRLALAIPVVVLSGLVCVLISDNGQMALAGLLMSLAVIFGALASARVVFQLRVMNTVPARVELANGVLWGLAVLVLAAAGGGLVAFAAAFLITMAITQVALLVMSLRVLPVTWRGSGRHWPVLIRVGIPVSIAGVLVLSFGKIDQVLVFEIAGDKAAGIYGAAYRILDRAALLPGTVMATFYPLIAAAHGNDPARTRRLFQAAWDLLAVLALPILAIFVVAADPLALALFGADFADSARVLPVLMGAFVLVCFGYLSGYMIIILSAQRRFIVVCVVALVLNVAANLLLLPSLGYLAAAWITVATEVFVLVLSLRLVLPQIGHRLVLGRTLRTAAAATGMAAGVAGAAAVGAPLALQLLVAALLYPALVLLLRAVTREDLALIRAPAPEEVEVPTSFASGATGISGASAPYAPTMFARPPVAWPLPERMRRRDLLALTRPELGLIAAALPVAVLVGAAVPELTTRFGVFKLVWVVIAGGAAIFAARSIQTTLMVLFVALAFPFRTTLAFDIEIHTTHLLLFLLIGQLVVGTALQEIRIPRGILAPMAVIVFGAVVASVGGPDLSGSLFRTFTGLVPALAVGVAAAAVLRPKRDLATLITTGSVALVGTALLALGQKAGVTPSAIAPVFEADRVNGLFQHPNVLGGYLAAMMVLLIALSASAWKRAAAAQTLMLPAVGLGLVALGVTLSRGAIVGLAAGTLVVVALLFARRELAGILGLVVVAVVGLALALPQVPESEKVAFQERFNKVLVPGSETGRSLIYEEARRQISLHPFTGVGPLTFGDIIARRTRLPLLQTGLGHAHNLELEAYLSLGPLGAFGLLWFTFAALRRLLRRARDQLSDPLVAGWAIGCIAAVASMIVQQFADFLFRQEEMFVLFMLLLGSAFALEREQEEEVAAGERAPGDLTTQQDTSHALPA